MKILSFACLECFKILIRYLPLPYLKLNVKRKGWNKRHPINMFPDKISAKSGTNVARDFAGPKSYLIAPNTCSLHRSQCRPGTASSIVRRCERMKMVKISQRTGINFSDKTKDFYILNERPTGNIILDVSSSILGRFQSPVDTRHATQAGFSACRPRSKLRTRVFLDRQMPAILHRKVHKIYL